MSKYYVRLFVSDEYGIELEASSPEEAQEKAKEVWEEDGSSGFEFLATHSLEYEVEGVIE